MLGGDGRLPRQRPQPRRRGQATSARRRARLLRQVLPEVFDRFAEAAARVAKKDLETLLTSENLHGLTPVFAQLNLVRDVKGKPVFNTDSGPLAEVLSRINNQYDYGVASTGQVAGRRVRQGTLRVGVRHGPALCCRPRACGKDRGDQQGADDRIGPEHRGPGYLREQQSLSPNVVPSQERGRGIRGPVEGRRRVQASLRQGAARAGAGCGNGRDPRRVFPSRAGRAETQYPGSSHIGCRAPKCLAGLWSNYERSARGARDRPSWHSRVVITS